MLSSSNTQQIHHHLSPVINEYAVCVSRKWAMVIYYAVKCGTQQILKSVQECIQKNQKHLEVKLNALKLTLSAFFFMEDSQFHRRINRELGWSLCMVWCFVSSFHIHYLVQCKCKLLTSITPTLHNRFTALFPRPSGWAIARKKPLDFMVQGKINRGRQTDHPAGRHSNWTKQCPPPPSPHCFTGQMPFLPPKTNSSKALKATNC